MCVWFPLSFENADFQKNEKKSPDIVAIYHKNPKVKVSDVLTGFCCPPKFCDGHIEMLPKISRICPALSIAAGLLESAKDLKNGSFSFSVHSFTFVTFLL